MQAFLTKIKHILEKNEEISRLKHESFNIFSILRKEKEEERLHSAFLAALLDVNGSHGMGSVFCDLFVNQFVNQDEKINFIVDESVKVYVEKSVREGRLDICLENGLNQVVVIENKLDAKDQPKQLIRYFDYLVRRKCKNSLLFYLTLDGKDPDDISITDKDPNDETKIRKLKSDEDFHLISYESHVLKWLEACIKEAAEIPTVRETIKQYIILVKKITGQLTNHIMGQEVDSTIKKNFKEARLVAKNWERVLQESVQSFLNAILEKVKASLGETSWGYDIGTGTTNYKGITIWNNLWEEKICIRLDGDKKISYDTSYLGLYANKTEWDRVDVKNKLRNLEVFNDGFDENNDYWPYIKTAFDFGKDEYLEKLFDDTERQKLIDAIAEQLISIANACGDKLHGVKKAVTEES